MLHLLEDKITEKKSTSVVFDCEVEFSWSLSQHTMLYDLNLFMGLRGQSHDFSVSALKPCSNLAQTSSKLQSNLAQTSLKLCSNLAQTSLKPRLNLSQTSLKPRSNLAQTSLKARSKLAQNLLKAHSNLAQTSRSLSKV